MWCYACRPNRVSHFATYFPFSRNGAVTFCSVTSPPPIPQQASWQINPRPESHSALSPPWICHEERHSAQQQTQRQSLSVSLFVLLHPHRTKASCREYRCKQPVCTISEWWQRLVNTCREKKLPQLFNNKLRLSQWLSLFLKWSCRDFAYIMLKLSNFLLYMTLPFLNTKL